MYLSLNWLQDYVKIPKGVTAEELATRLSLHTVEVEKVEKQSDKFGKVVVGRILEVRKHPNADRLQLAEVEVGGKQPLHIVCGAPNIAPDQLVPVALVGALLPNGLEIKKAEVRGETSEGMLCAPDELGLGDDHSGILILEGKAKVGQPLAKYLGLDDVVLEVDNKSLTNRPDLWGHLGMAREISAFLETKFTDYKPNHKLFAKPTKGFSIEAKVEDTQLCQRYMAVGIENVTIAPSPDWLQQRLIAVGSRPINNVVDITNYVMLELGQPLHAFDKERLDRIVVRRAKSGEQMETLDGQKRELTNEMLVIADSSKPVALAGVMGGANSEINDNTKNIVIESANFDFVSIRKTSGKLALRTESSMRFEKALDPYLAETAIARATELILKVCPSAKVATELVDVFPAKKKDLDVIKLDLAWLNSMIGEDFKAERVISILESLGFGVKQDKEALAVTVPTWRATKDVSIREDLAEEVARIYGFNNIKTVMPLVAMLPPEKNEERDLERQVRELLAFGTGLFEVYNYSFVGEEQLKKLFIDTSTHLRLVNPLASHQTMMRQSLLPNLVDAVKTNQPRYKDFGLFEIGSIYLDLPSEVNKDSQPGESLPYQEKRLGLVMASDNTADLLRRVKGALEYLTESLNLHISWQPNEITPNWSDKARYADIAVNGKVIGWVGQLDVKVAKSLGIKKATVVAEVSLRHLLALAKKQGHGLYQEFEKFPPLVRDLAFVVNEKILYSEISQEILKFNPLIKQAELFDVFQGGKLGEENKSLAFHVTYQADRTLTGEEVDKVQAKLLERMAERFDAKFRDF